MEGLFGEVIYGYSRNQAIADGALVDVTETAREAGIKFPTAVTAAVWNGLVVPEDYDREKWGQSEAGRLWDILWMLRVSASRSRGDVIRYRLYFRLHGQKRIKELKAVCGPGDDLNPVITVMLPEED